MISIRRAYKTDARFLVPLVAESSGGVWPAIWRASASQHESVEESGVRYILNIDNNLSIVNTVIVELDARRIGAMVCFREEARAHTQESAPPLSPLPPALNNALKPYRELTDPDSLYISELCIMPAARGKGVGTRLLEHAIVLAADQCLPRVTLRVFSENVGAVRLYQRFGFEQAGERPVLPHPDINFSGSVILMSYSL